MASKILRSTGSGKACELFAPSNYLDICWLILRMVLHCSQKGNSTGNVRESNLYNALENYIFTIKTPKHMATIDSWSGPGPGSFIVHDGLSLPQTSTYSVKLGGIPWQQCSWGPHGAHLGPVGPSWALCRPHESCYLGIYFSTYPLLTMSKSSFWVMSTSIVYSAYFVMPVK